MNRRHLFACAAGGLVSLAAPGIARAAGAPRRLSFVNTHTGETFSDAYFEGGDYVPDALAAIDRVMRDHRSGEVHAIDRGLLDFLATLHGEIGSPRAPFQIISGYRSPKTNAKMAKASSGVATRSLHMVGKAIDIRVEGVDTAGIRDAAIGMQRGGVGYYAGSDFVHVDTGRVRRW